MSKMGSTCLLPFGAGAFAFDGFLALFAFFINSILKFAARRFFIFSQIRMSRQMLSIHLSNSKWLPRHDLKNLGRYDAEIISKGYLPLVSITTTVEAGAWLFVA